MGIINAQLNVITAKSRFQPGSYVWFGKPNQIPDPDNPATLKIPYLDPDLTQPASAIQGLDSDSKFQQTITGLLYGSGLYSIRVMTAADNTGKQLYYIPEVTVTPTVNELGTAAYSDIATEAEALAGTAGVLPDAAQVRRNHVAQVATIADLRALEPAFDGQQVELLGHTVAGLGGGMFYADFSSSAADDNGVTVVTTGGERWVRKLEGFVSPEMFGAIGDGVTDDTQAVQSSVNSHRNVNFRIATYKITGTIECNLFGQCLTGPGHKYAPTIFTYAGAGTAFKFTPTANYARMQGGICIQGVPSVGTDYYNTGSVAVDVRGISVSIEIDNCWISRFETLVLGDYNSFYNKFTDNRFEKFRWGLKNFSSNNLEISGNRFQEFNVCVMVNGGNGPTNISKNAFEVFNGELVISTGAEYPSVNFTENYVEDYYANDLPTNFPRSSGSFPDKFGGGILFSGSAFGMLNVSGNDMQIASIFRILSCGKIKHLNSENNQLAFSVSGNNLNYLFVFDQSETIFLNVADTRAKVDGPAAPFSTAYSQTALGTVSLDNHYYFYDCFSGENRNRPANLNSPSLVNGWVNESTGAYDFKCLKSNGSTILCGIIDGTGKSGDIFATIPASHRPDVYGSTKPYSFFTCLSNYGGGTPVRMRYFYGTGEVRAETGEPSYANISLDGVLIPPRY